MRNEDLHIAAESVAIMKADRIVGRDMVNLAQRFAIKQDLYIWHYNEFMDTWQLADGEIYTSARIKEEMEKA